MAEETNSRFEGAAEKSGAPYAVLEEMNGDRSLAAAFLQYGRRLKEQDPLAFEQIMSNLSAERPVTIGNSGLAETLYSLDSIMAYEDYDEECLRPTDSAYHNVRHLLTAANAFTNGDFPVGAVCPDDEGGLLVEWVSSRHYVRLIYPSRQGFAPYLYHEAPQGYASNYTVTPETLAERLNWLNENARRKL